MLIKQVIVLVSIVRYSWEVSFSDLISKLLPIPKDIPLCLTSINLLQNSEDKQLKICNKTEIKLAKNEPKNKTNFQMLHLSIKTNTDEIKRPRLQIFFLIFLPLGVLTSYKPKPTFQNFYKQKN